MSSKRSRSYKRQPQGRGPKRSVSPPEETVTTREGEPAVALEDELEAELEDETIEALEEELEEELEEGLEEALEEELEEEREQGFREEVEQAVLDSLTEASNALTEAENAVTDTLGRIAQAESRLKDAQAAGGKALERVVFAWNGVAELMQNEEPERGSAAIFDTSENGAPDDDAEAKSDDDTEAKSDDGGKAKTPESGIVAQARAVERQARALSDAQMPKSDPGD